MARGQQTSIRGESNSASSKFLAPLKPEFGKLDLNA